MVCSNLNRGGGWWVLSHSDYGGDHGGVRCVWVIVIFELGYSGWLVGLGLSVVLVVSGGWLAIGGCVWYWFVVSLWWECDWVCFGCICKGGCWLVYNWFWVVGMWLGLPLVFFFNDLYSFSGLNVILGDKCKIDCRIGCSNR